MTVNQINGTAPKWTEEEDQRLIALKNQKRSFMEIAQEIGRTPNACEVRCSVLRRSGVEIDRRRKKNRAAPPRIDRADLERMWKAGVPTEEIAQHFGSSESWVRKKARDFDLDRRPPGHLGFKSDKGKGLVEREVGPSERPITGNLAMDLMASRGQYPMLRRIAERYHLTDCEVTMGWHCARVARPLPQSLVDKSRGAR